ncbi:MAG: hypothetical protein AB7R89_11940 [Dehalococcoidia bacterium]
MRPAAPFTRRMRRALVVLVVLVLGLSAASPIAAQGPITPWLPGGLPPGVPGGVPPSQPAGHPPVVPGAVSPLLPGSAQSSSSSCAWGFNSNLSNVAYPDRNATYFGSVISLPAGSKLVITGLYPYNRYFSFNVYNLTGQSIGSLSDYQIAPDPGSTNPFAVVANPPPAQREYTVSIVSGGSAGTNIIPIDAATSRFLLIYRVYVPNQGLDETAGVPLPSVVIQAANGQAQTIPLCTQQGGSGVLSEIFAFLNQFPLPTRIDNMLCQWRGAFGRPGNLSQNLIPNPDNAYLCAVTEWQPGRVAVIRGRAPTFPATFTGGSVITTPPSQVRYWSFCTNLVVVPFPVVDCTADYETAVDSQGQYYYAISIPSDRPANATTANGVTWLDWGRTDVLGALILRHMLPNANFTQTVKNIPINGTPQQSAQVMGPYYPVLAYCTKAQFEAGGPQGCFAAGLPGLLQNLR